MITLNREPIPAEVSYQYDKNPGWMTREEREVHYNRRRQLIEGWATPLNVQEVKAGEKPVYDSLYLTDDVIPSISLVSNMWVKQMIFERAGDIHPGHSHSHDHQTLLARGSVEVIANGETTKFVAPTIIYIKAGVQHGMVALEDTTVIYCIHPLRDGERVEDIIDPESVPNGVMPLVDRLPKILTPTDRI